MNGFPLEPDSTCSGWVKTADDIEQRRFPGAIGPDETNDVSLLHGEADVGEGDDTTEFFCDLDHFEKAHPVYGVLL